MKQNCLELYNSTASFDYMIIPDLISYEIKLINYIHIAGPGASCTHLFSYITLSLLS